VGIVWLLAIHAFDAQRPKTGTNMTNLRIRVQGAGADSHSSECNAVLYYEADYVPETSKQVVKKIYFDPVQTEPALQTLFVIQSGTDGANNHLDQFVTQHVNSTASNCVLYSNEGLAKRWKTPLPEKRASAAV
jgi:hypothetical protein